MNSCTIAYAFYENDVRINRYAEALTSSGSRTDAFGVRGPGKSKREVINGVNLYRIQKRLFDAQGGPLDYLWKMTLFFLHATARLLVYHLRYRYRLIIVHSSPDFFVFIALIPRLLGAKVILDIHDIMPEFYSQRFGKPFDSLPVKILRFIEKRAVRFADFVIAGNDIWSRKIADRTGIPQEKCRGILNYPHLDFFEEVSYVVRPKRLKLVYPGHLSHHHGADIAVRAMPLITATVPKARLDIYGSSWIPQYLDQLKRLIRDLRLDGIVTIHPPLAVRELAEVYKKVDIGLVPKRDGLFAGEAFSSKIFDYMACGIPIVASRTAIDEYYFDDSQIKFFEPGRPESLAAAVLDLYQNPALRLELSRKGREYAVANNWETMKKSFLDIVRRTLGDLPETTAVFAAGGEARIIKQEES